MRYQRSRGCLRRIMSKKFNTKEVDQSPVGTASWALLTEAGKYNRYEVRLEFAMERERPFFEKLEAQYAQAYTAACKREFAGQLKKSPFLPWQEEDGWDFNTVARKKTTAPFEQEASAPTPTPKTETAPQPDIEQQLTAGDEEVAPVAVAIAGNPDDDIPF